MRLCRPVYKSILAEDYRRRVINVVGIIQRQLDSIAMFLRLRSTGHRSAVTSETGAPPASGLEDRSADDGADKRGPAAGVDAPVTAGHDAAAQ